MCVTMRIDTKTHVCDTKTHVCIDTKTHVCITLSETVHRALHSLHCIAVRCSELQHCNTLQRAAVRAALYHLELTLESVRCQAHARNAHCNTLATQCNTLQHSAKHYCSLQHTATHCKTLQHIATYCSTLQHTVTASPRADFRIRAKHVTKKLTAPHCNTLQHTVTLCNTLQHSATL